MFDFENTPITKYTKLKANYMCQGEPLLTYNGDWARVTLTDGTVLEAQSEAELNSLLPATSTATLNGQTVNVSAIQKIEFGTKVTSMPTNSLPTKYWSALESVNGFHEGLTTIANNFFNGGSSSYTASLIQSTIILPSTLTSVGESALAYNNYFVGTLVMNANPSPFFNDNPTRQWSVDDSTAPTYTQGIKITGKYSSDFITKFPNLNGPQYRNLYNGNTLDALDEALQSGQAPELFPVGTKIPDLYNNATAFNWVVAHYGIAEQEDGSKVSGVVLIPDKNIIGTTYWGGSGANYSTSAVRESVNASSYSESITSKTIPIKVPYLTLSSVAPSTAVYDKFFALSNKEVMGANTYSQSVVGEGLEYFSSITNGAYNDGSYTGRYLYGAAWLRDGYNAGNSYFIYTSGQITTSTLESSRNLSVGCFVPGKLPYTVTFDSAGASDVPEQTVLFGSYAKKPTPDPTLEGSEFVGWFLAGQVPASLPGEIPVMFRMNGGEGQTPAEYATSGATVAEPANPTREGWEFLGWYKAGEIPANWDGVTIV